MEAVLWISCLPETTIGRKAIIASSRNANASTRMATAVAQSWVCCGGHWLARAWDWRKRRHLHARERPAPQTPTGASPVGAHPRDQCGYERQLGSAHRADGR